MQDTSKNKVNKFTWYLSHALKQFLDISSQWVSAAFDATAEMENEIKPHYFHELTG